jgi:hypothetical protein
MSFSDVKKWLDLVQMILPAILALKGVPSHITSNVVSLVGDAEVALGPGTGGQKLASVLKGVGDSMAAAGATPKHVADVQTAVQEGLATGIQVVNTVHDWHTAQKV